MKVIFELFVGSFFLVSSVMKVVIGQGFDTPKDNGYKTETSIDKAKEDALLKRVEKVLLKSDSNAVKIQDGIEIKNQTIDKLDDGNKSQKNSLRLLSKITPPLKQVEKKPVKFLRMKMRTIEPVSYTISDTVSLSLPEIEKPCDNKRPWFKRLFKR